MRYWSIDIRLIEGRVFIYTPYRFCLYLNSSHHSLYIIFLFSFPPLSVTETLLKMHSHGSSSSGGSLAGSPSLAPGEERLMVSWQDRQYAIKANDFVLVAFRLPFAFVPRPTSKKTNAFRFCQKNHCISTTAAGINHANTCTTTCFRSRHHRRRCTTPPRHH